MAIKIRLGGPAYGRPGFAEVSLSSYPLRGRYAPL